MKKQVKKSAIVIEYEKNRKRIQRFLNRAEARGYQFQEGVLPKIPKRITKASVRRLQKLTTHELYKKSVYGGEATYGEIVSGVKGREAEKKVRALKSAATRKTNKIIREEFYKSASAYERAKRLIKEEFRRDGVDLDKEAAKEFKAPRRELTDEEFFTNVIISNWYATLDQFPGEAAPMLRAWMGGIIRENGKAAAAEMIQKATEAGDILTYETVYNMEKALSYIARVLKYLPDSGILYEEEQMERAEWLSRLGEEIEKEEDWSYPL